MILNKNSVTSRLYRWFYMTDKMPESLCPYFWKLIVMYVFLIPVFIINLPVYLINWFGGDVEVDTFTERILFGLVLYLLSFMTLNMLFTLITLPIWGFFKNETLDSLQMTGVFTFILTLSCVLGLTIQTLSQKVKDRKRRKRYAEQMGEKFEHSNIITEFIKAKYNKYCPKIDWK